jgi:pimeloyl-ACP methyl ester carboxylesterase
MTRVMQTYSTWALGLAALGAALACSSTDEHAVRHPPIDGGAVHADAAVTDAAVTDADVTDAAVPLVPTRKVSANGFVFDVRVDGPANGPAVILLHGFPETSYEWRYQFAALTSAGYRVIAPDQRGYSPGARPPNVSDYGVLLLAQDVTAIADALGVKRFHLVGHDWGGGVAWAVGKIFASRIITLNILSTPHPDALIHELSDKTSCQYQDSAYFDTFTAPGAAATFLANDNAGLRLFYTGFAKKDADVYVNALGSDAALTAALDWYAANIKDRQFNLPALGAITVPTMLVWGDQDAFFCKATVELTSQSVTAPYRLEELPGINHWVPETAADKVNSLLLEQVSRFGAD